MSAKFMVSYDIVSAESVMEGDVSEEGIIGRNLSLREAVQSVQESRTSRNPGIMAVECDSYPALRPEWIMVMFGSEYETGDTESRYLHIPPHVTTASRRRIARILGASGL